MNALQSDNITPTRLGVWRAANMTTLKTGAKQKKAQSVKTVDKNATIAKTIAQIQKDVLTTNHPMMCMDPSTRIAQQGLKKISSQD
jgi:hypothetical protein